MSERLTVDTLDDVERGHHVFVPAVMSVGVLFSVATLVRDAITRSERRSIRRRGAFDGRSVADHVLGGTAPPADEPTDPAFRRLAALTGAPLLAVAVYLVPGSTLNYLRTDGYVSDIAWLLALSLTVALALGASGAMLLGVAVRWPTPWPRSRAAARSLAGLDLTGDGQHRPTRWDAVAIVASVVTAALMLAVSSSPTVRRIDEELADRIREAWPASLGLLDDLYGRTEIALALAIVVGISTLRCRPFAITYVVSVAVALGISNGVRFLVDRDRPPMSDVDVGSFPSGHMIQATLFVGLVPLALTVLRARTLTVRSVRAVLLLATLLAGFQRIADGNHWPADVVAGVGIAVFVLAVGRIALTRPRSHRRCEGCPWSAGAAR